MRTYLASRVSLFCYTLLGVFLLCVLCDAVVSLSSLAGEPARANVNQLIPLPILAQPAPDRASLDDPTRDASTAAAIAAPIPPRTRKAPFVKRTFPDPYERRRTDVPVLEESQDFPLGSPQQSRR